MTQEQLLEYNKMCAKFLGVDNTLSCYYLPKFGLYKNSYGEIYYEEVFNEDELKFHSDWNWIIEVVEVIEKLGYYTKNECIRNVNYFNIYELKNNEETFYGSGNNSKKEAVVQAIYQFLKWHNNETKTN